MATVVGLAQAPAPPARSRLHCGPRRAPLSSRYPQPPWRAQGVTAAKLAGATSPGGRFCRISRDNPTTNTECTALTTATG